MWHVQVDDEVKLFTEKKLRKKLRKRDLSGLELARPDGSESWVPLHETPLFRQEVAVVGSARSAARAQVSKKLMIHALVFVCVIAGFTFNDGFPFWAFFWAIGLGAHGLTVWTRLRADEANSAASGLESTPAVSEQRSKEEADRPSAASDNRFLSSIDSALSESGLSADVQTELAASARELHEKGEALQKFLAPGIVEALESAATNAREQALKSQNEQDKEVFEAEVTAIEQRREHLEHARQQLNRLEAQQRTLLHQIEGLRLGSIQHESLDVPDLQPKLTAIRRQLHADEEIDEALARARRAAHARRVQ